MLSAPSDRPSDTHRPSSLTSLLDLPTPQSSGQGLGRFTSEAHASSYDIQATKGQFLSLFGTRRQPRTLSSLALLLCLPTPQFPSSGVGADLNSRRVAYCVVIVYRRHLHIHIHPHTHHSSQSFPCCHRRLRSFRTCIRSPVQGHHRARMSATLSLGSVADHKYDTATSMRLNGKKYFALGKMENSTDTARPPPLRTDRDGACG